MVKVKICGLRTPGDAAFVNEAKADYAGMVFAPGKRQVTAARAAAIRAALDEAIPAVGVFVNQPVAEVAALLQSGSIQIAQLHGEEDSAYIEVLRGLVPGAKIIKMAPVGSCLPPLPAGTDYVLLDTLSPARGGTGTAFDWALLAGYTGPPFFLAGGLTPENVAAAIRATSPYCVDVSSGVETDGRKDREKILEFVQNARNKELEP